jgi:hypothetical protein
MSSLQGPRGSQFLPSLLHTTHADLPQAFAALNLRNVYSFGMNYFISSWISSMGPLQVFSTIGGLHIFIMLLTIPMWIFGKRARSLTARVPFFKAMQGQ